MITLHSSISKRNFLRIGQLLCVALFLGGCASSRMTFFTPIPTEKTKQLSAQFSAILPRDNQKVKGLLKLTQGTDLQLSFRAPIVGNEMMRIVLTQDSVLMIDRIHKCYVKTTPFLFANKFDPAHASNYSLQKTEKKLWRLSTKETAIVKASTLGCPIMSDTEVTLYQISDEPFIWHITTISSRYEELSLEEYLEIKD
ncbi:MAG: DUF4292 domain-containing protein [Bacteroidaceae bacterium]